MAGLFALCAIALKFSFTLVFACICLATVAAHLLVALHQSHRRTIDRSGSAIGQFMRGSLQARLTPASADDEFSRLQHRINNLLDVIDLHLRGSDAAIDLEKYSDYASKLRLTGLSEALNTRADDGDEPQPAEAPATSAPNPVGNFLKELRQQAEGFFSPEAASEQTRARETYPRELDVVRRGLQQAASRLQTATGQLAQRAMHPTPKTEPVRGSSKHLEASCARLAEQATVLALNVAIEAGRASPLSPLHGAVQELQSLARQLQQLRQDLTRTLPPQPEAQLPSVPLSVAVEALTTAEQQLRAQLETLQTLTQRGAQSEPESTEAEAA